MYPSSLFPISSLLDTLLCCRRRRSALAAMALAHLALLLAVLVHDGVSSSSTHVTQRAENANSGKPHWEISLRLLKRRAGVIVQMFQWNWDSIARECGEFLGPAGTLLLPSPAAQCAHPRTGYKFVQGNVHPARAKLLPHVPSFAASRAHRRPAVVDGLPTCVIQDSVKAWQPCTV